jgi:hypothetical protein
MPQTMRTSPLRSRPHPSLLSWPPHVPRTRSRPGQEGAPRSRRPPGADRGSCGAPGRRRRGGRALREISESFGRGQRGVDRDDRHPAAGAAHRRTASRTHGEERLRPSGLLAEELTESRPMHPRQRRRGPRRPPRRQTNPARSRPRRASDTQSRSLGTGKLLTDARGDALRRSRGRWTRLLPGGGWRRTAVDHAPQDDCERGLDDPRVDAVQS